MAKQILDSFFESLMTDLDIQQQLLKLDNLGQFCELAQRIGQERGYNFSLREMEDYIKKEIFPSSDQEELRNLSTTPKPWLKFISQLKWAKGKNSQVWSKLKEL